MNINNDAALITKFVQGQNSFIANQDLKIELAFDSTQLLTRRGGLIASLRQEDNLPTIVVRRGCDHWNLLHYTLLKHGFMPLLNVGSDKVFARYQKRELPPGYKLNATDASALWKEWWTNSRSGNRDRVEFDMLLFTKKQWFAIRDITCKQGVFFIKTLGPEVVRQASEPVIWLNRVAHSYLESALRQPQVTDQIEENNSPKGISSPSQSAQPSCVGAETITGVRGAADQTSISNKSQAAGLEQFSSTVGQAELAPDLRQVVRVHQGKLYVMTPLGEIIVEGNNLKFRLNSLQSAVADTLQQNSQDIDSINRDRQVNRQPQAVAIGF